MPNFSDIYPSGGGIKSVQRGVVTPGATAGATVTIGAVNQSKTVVFADVVDSVTSATYAQRVGAQLLSATQLNVVGFTVTGGGTPIYIAVAWQVVEFY